MKIWKIKPELYTMMVPHTVVVAADQMAVVADQMVVAELELHTEVVVQKSVVDFGLIRSKRSRDFGLIGPMRSRDWFDRHQKVQRHARPVSPCSSSLKARLTMYQISQLR